VRRESFHLLSSSCPRYLFVESLSGSLSAIILITVNLSITTGCEVHKNNLSDKDV
jgi:hypothetical protein